MAPPPGILEVRCAGCGETLEVEHGLTEFACPDCGMAQELPPELKPPRPRRALPLPGRVPPAAHVRVTCGGCGSVLSVPQGPGRFACSLCGAELATSPATAIPVMVTPPAAVPLPITSIQPPKPSEVQDAPSSQSALAGKVQKHIHSEQTHIQHPKHYINEDSSNSFRTDTRTQISAVGRLQNEPPNLSVLREESHTEPLRGTIGRPGPSVLQKKYRFVVGPKSCEAGKVQEDNPNQVVNASQEQGLPSSSIEHEQIGSLHQNVNRHQAGENLVHVDKEKVDLDSKAKGNKKKSAKDTKGNQKRKAKSLMNSTNELSHLRRSKRLSNLSPDLIDTEPIRRLDAPLNQKQSDAPHTQSTIADPDPSSPSQYRCHQAGTNELDNIDETTPPTLNHGNRQTEQFPQCYSQMYSPETGWARPNPSSNSWHEHEIPQKSLNGIDHLGRSDEEIRSSPPENQNQYMNGHVAEEAYSGKNHSEQSQLKPYSENFVEHGRPISLTASCSRLAALLPVPGTSTLPTIASLSSLEKLPFHCSSPKTPHHQPRPPIDYKDAQYGDMLSGSLTKSSKKRKGRPPAVLMEPRKEADRPVLTPHGTENWSVHPHCSKVTTTLSLLIKQNYPGTYVSEDTNGKPCELVVHYWHQYPSDIRATVLDEFLKRFKWSPGQEEECQKIFDRKAVRQLVNLFCYEKQRVREELAEKKGKRSYVIDKTSGEMALEEGDGKDSEGQQGDESVVVPEHDDPLNWKPFVPEWMKPTWWEMLCDHWSNDEFMKVSYQKRKNRNAGNHPCSAAASRSMGVHQRIISMDNGRELVSDIRTSTKSGERELIGKKALQTEAQVGGSKSGRYDGASVAKKAHVDSMSKSSQVCFSKQGRHPLFTQEQVQQMISQALQGLNDTWEKKFMTLEQNMHRVSSSRTIPVGAKGSAVAVGGDEHCQLACQDTIDSLDGEKNPAARGDGKNREHWS